MYVAKRVKLWFIFLAFFRAIASMKKSAKSSSITFALIVESINISSAVVIITGPPRSAIKPARYDSVSV